MVEPSPPIRVPFNDLSLQYSTIRADIDAAIQRVIERSAFIGGEELERFEQAFAAFCEVPDCAGVANGTDAIELTLVALGIEPGDEVIVPAMTFVATVEPVLAVGAVPIAVDIEPMTGNLSPAAVEAAITTRTRGIIAVHLHGLMSNMVALRQIADRRGLFLVEDAAQAHGARLDGQRAGSMGDAAIFSFFPGKNLGAYGDGGAVVSRQADLVARVRQLRNHGRSPNQKHVHAALGRNSRLDNLQAAILEVKLGRLDAWNEARRAIANRYQAALGQRFGTPTVPDGFEHVYHIYCLRLPERDRMASWLLECGISSGLHYPIPIHLQPGLSAHLGGDGISCPEAEELAATCLSVPIFPEMSEAQVAAVIDALKRAP